MIKRRYFIKNTLLAGVGISFANQLHAEIQNEIISRNSIAQGDYVVRMS